MAQFDEILRGALAKTTTFASNKKNIINLYNTYWPLFNSKQICDCRSQGDDYEMVRVHSLLYHGYRLYRGFIVLSALQV